MSRYLQRLLDRGASLAASTLATSVAPAAVTGSPAVAFDQRLANPGLAEDFGIFGLTPDAPEAGEIIFDERGTDFPVPPPAASAPMARSSSITGPDAPTPGQAATTTVPIDRAPPISSTDPRETVPAARPEISARLPDPSPARPILAPVEETGRPAPRPSSVAAQPPVSPSFVPPNAVERSLETRILREPAPALVAQPAAPSTASTVSVPPAHERVTGLPQAKGDQSALPSAIPPVVPSEITPARPASPPPLAEVAPVTADAREVERIVREAVRLELARVRPAEKREGDRASAAANDAEKTPASPPRPATARDASVIGELEPSSRPLTIYGLRRR